MSFKLSALVLEHGPRVASAKLLLICLADRADANGVCFPSRADLMERSGLGRSAVTEHLRALERDGWLQRKQRFQSSNVFRVNVQRLLDLAADREAQRKVPLGFDLFPEEIAANRAQALEKKDDAVKRSQDAGKRSQDAAFPATNLSVNLSLKRPAALLLSDRDFERYLRDRLPGETRQDWVARVAS